MIEPVHSGSSNILLVPFLEHIVDIKLSILDWFKSKYQASNHFSISYSLRNIAVKLARLASATIFELQKNEKFATLQSWDRVPGDSKPFFDLQGLLALCNYWPTSSWNSCIHTQALIQLIIFSSLLPQTRSCPANFFLKFYFLHLLSRSNILLRFPQCSEAAQILSLTKWSFIH